MNIVFERKKPQRINTDIIRPKKRKLSDPKLNNLKMRTMKGFRPKDNIKYDTKLLKEEDNRQKYEEKLQRIVQINDQDSI